MVTDNEILKRDNAELQHLLTEAREEIHCLQEEVEERRANPTTPRISGGATPVIRLARRLLIYAFTVNTPITRHQHSGSVPTANLKDFIVISRFVVYLRPLTFYTVIESSGTSQWRRT